MLLLFILGIACVGVLYMFFSHQELFGLKYISYNNQIKSKGEYVADDYDKVVLNSRDYEIKIISSSNNLISLKLYSNSFGFVLTKNSTYSISEKTNGTTLEFNITEPYGAAIVNKSYIQLSLPEKLFELDISNNRSYTSINSDKITLSKLSYKTKNGDFSFNKGSVENEMDLNLGNAAFKISNEVNTNLCDLNLKLTTGKFDAQKSNFGNVTLSSINNGMILINEAAEIRQNSKSAGGSVNVKKASYIGVESSDTHIIAGEVTNGVNINLSAYGSVKITSLTGNSSIMTNDGKISIGSANSNIYLRSKNGDITINNAYLAVDVGTNYGTINISYPDNALSYDETTKSRSVIATLANGKIVAKGVEHAEIIITAKGRADITFNNIVGSNSITSNKGSVYVVVNKNASFKLTTQSQTGKVNVNLTQIPEYLGYTTKETRTEYINSTSSTYNNNELIVATESGNLSVYDTNFN